MFNLPYILWEVDMKGQYKRSKETIKKLSETRKRLFQEGKIMIWNKGLDKSDHRVLKNISSEGSRKTQFKSGPRPETKGKLNPYWKGGKIIHQGYVYIRVPDHPYAKRGYVQKHRLVIEKYMGRYLEPREIVHHINHNTLDNRIKNLMLLSKGEHTTLHNIKRWRKKKGDSDD